MRKPDPDGQNLDRADWAQQALKKYQRITRTDEADALKDLLCDLMHMCDVTDEDFEVALDSARRHYVAETTEG